MASVNRIIELSSIISKETAAINSFLVSNGLRTPSLDADALQSLPIPDEAKDIKAARLAVIEACSELEALMTGPRELLRFKWTAYSSVKAILRFKLDRAFPVGEATSFEALSNFSGLNVMNVRRIVRHAILNHHFFQEKTPGVITHSALTAVLARDDLMRNSLIVELDEFWPAGLKMADAMERFGLFFSKPDPTADGLLNDYPWEDKKTMVDVGGSYGSVAISIAERYPDIKCIVQDLPDTVAEGALRLPVELRNRVTFMAHADIYYFRSIFHNWADKYCIKILQNLIPALQPGAKILIHERVLPGLEKLDTVDAQKAM
ncbi:hypothetical protein SLS62_008188 [Diatrype stigma]|uniref:O-methyltransferase C-terminal domain-containing protein n=1 Tax=Diatrype stigma TaxID=117547 RepID=A0AAN9UK06_9PEZI